MPGKRPLAEAFGGLSWPCRLGGSGMFPILKANMWPSIVVDSRSEPVVPEAQRTVPLFDSLIEAKSDEGSEDVKYVDILGLRTLPVGARFFR